MGTQTVTPPAEQPIELKLADGSVVKGNTMDEIVQTLSKMKVDTAAAYRQEKERAAALEAERDALRRAEDARVASQPKPVSGNGFDKQHYYELLNGDPIEAQNYLDAHRYGLGDPSQVVPTFQNINQQVTVLTQQTTAAAFQAAHPDFPAGAEAARAMRERTERFISEGHPFNLRTLNMAYSDLVNEGLIKPTVQEQEEEKETPPPSLSGAGAGAISESDAARLEQMSDKDLEAELRKRGMFR